MKHFDTIIHLGCDTALPTYLVIKQFDCPRHIIAVSHETEPAFNLLQRVLNEQGYHTEKLNISSDDLNTCRRRLSKVFSSLPEGQHTVNLTGGSRIMFAALFEIALQHNVPAFYLDTQTKALNWLDEEALQEPLHPVVDSVRDYIQLAGFDMDNEQQPLQLEEAAERRDAAMECWSHRQQIGIWSKSLRGPAGKPGSPFRDGPRKIKGLEVSAVLKKEADGHKGSLHIGEHVFTIKPWKDLAAFLTGNWYKDAVLANLMTLKNKGFIRDLAIQIQPISPKTETNGHMPAMDILFTDGINLIVVDCYLNWSDNRLIRRMVRQVRHLAGDFGHGILATAYEGRHDKPSKGRTVTTLFGPTTVTHPELFLS